MIARRGLGGCGAILLGLASALSRAVCLDQLHHYPTLKADGKGQGTSSAGNGIHGGRHSCHPGPAAYEVEDGRASRVDLLPFGRYEAPMG